MATMPGFTADASLSPASGHYRTSGQYCAITSRVGGAAVVTPALRRSLNVEDTVDCKTFPDSITCHECNSTGEGTMKCCRLRNPGDGCIILNDPNAVWAGSPWLDNVTLVRRSK